ncbi:hypothetical protein LY76DRAFT_228232 [Colletotrichum caudatum]|nr:hypothetical protein LY76DRAFT_228232 [Colletotrichum caudatum]
MGYTRPRGALLSAFLSWKHPAAVPPSTMVGDHRPLCISNVMAGGGVVNNNNNSSKKQRKSRVVDSSGSVCLGGQNRLVRIGLEALCALCGQRGQWRLRMSGISVGLVLFSFSFLSISFLFPLINQPTNQPNHKPHPFPPPFLPAGTNRCIVVQVALEKEKEKSNKPTWSPQRLKRAS